MSFTTAKGMVLQTAGKHYPAPMTAVKTIEAAAKLGRDEALKLETASFVPLARSNEARALVGIFLNDQFVKGQAKSWPRMWMRRNRRRCWALALWAAASPTNRR